MNEKQIEDIFGDSPEIPPDLSRQLRKKSDEELALYQKGWKATTAQWILAEKEWDRRMLMVSIRWQRTAILAGLLGTVLGAVLSMTAAYLLK
jgi:hypothetical protein